MPKGPLGIRNQFAQSGRNLVALQGGNSAPLTTICQTCGSGPRQARFPGGGLPPPTPPPTATSALKGEVCQAIHQALQHSSSFAHFQPLPFLSIFQAFHFNYQKRVLVSYGCC